MGNDITYWELDQAQLNLFTTYCSQNSIQAPTFTPYNGLFYLEQNTANLATYGQVFEDFDFEDGDLGNSFGTRSWSSSMVPSVLWP